MQKHKSYCKNVDGGFYVEDGCCTLCSVPWIVAPSLFTVDNQGRHCFVSKQPETLTELDQMVEVVHTSELACVRYRGTDNVILRRLQEFGVGAQCDRLTWWRRILLWTSRRTNRWSERG